MQIIFFTGTKRLWLAQFVNKFLVRHKKFGLAQNILEPVKGQGIIRINLVSFKARDSEPIEVPYSLNQYLERDFLATSYSKAALDFREDKKSY